MVTFGALFGPISGYFVGLKETICLLKTKLWVLFDPIFGHIEGTLEATLKPRGGIISIKLMVKIRKYYYYLHRKKGSQKDLFFLFFLDKIYTFPEHIYNKNYMLISPV